MSANGAAGVAGDADQRAGRGAPRGHLGLAVVDARAVAAPSVRSRPGRATRRTQQGGPAVSTRETSRSTCGRNRYVAPGGCRPRRRSHRRRCPAGSTRRRVGQRAAARSRPRSPRSQRVTPSAQPTFDAGEVALAPAQQQPAAWQAGRRRRRERPASVIRTLLTYAPPSATVRRAAPLLADESGRGEQVDVASGSSPASGPRRAAPRSAPRRASRRRASRSSPPPNSAAAAALTRSVSSAPCVSVVTSSARARCAARRNGFSATCFSSSSISSRERNV